MNPEDPEAISLFLLKTKSNPGDGYEEQFAAVKDGLKYEPVFVPVLDHSFKEKGMRTMRNLIRHDRFGTHDGAKYGGLIFTSQHSVDAFAKLVTDESVREIHDHGPLPHLQQIPVYTVGPATTRALRSIHQLPSLQTFGSSTGNGEALAHFILDHYVDWYRDLDSRPPLLFLVGEQRRDIIPQTLMNPGLPVGYRVDVHEVVVYETGVMESFEEDFSALVRKTGDRNVRWVVVFSPTGCEGMLRALGMLDVGTGRVREGMSRRGTYIATIGPTTRDHLRERFGFDPDVCAQDPSPSGVEIGIRKFMRGLRQ